MNLKHRSSKGKTSCLAVRYLNQPDVSKTKETSGVGGLALYSHVWLAMCLFQTAVFETHVWAIKSLMSDTCFIHLKTLSGACTTGTFSPSFPCRSPICSNPSLPSGHVCYCHFHKVLVNPRPLTCLGAPPPQDTLYFFQNTHPVSCLLNNRVF